MTTIDPLDVALDGGKPLQAHGFWDSLLIGAEQDAVHNLAFPGATDITYPQLAGLLTSVLYNNIGSPYAAGHGRNHTRDAEIRVVNMVGDILHAPPSRWGYVTTGATEGTEHALLEARRRYPQAVVYTSAAAHFKIGELVEKLMMPLVVIGTDDGGAINLDDLAGELARRRDRPAVIVAIAGTTVTEAVDDIPAIVAVCDRLSITRRRIHVDAALSGIPLALLPVPGVPTADFSVRGVDSVIVSGHKFLSTLEPCGVLVYRQPPMVATAPPVSYTGTPSVTITSSRSGHTVLRLLASLALGHDEHRRRVHSSRQVAAYAQQRLRHIGVDARRHEHAFTVYYPPLPDTLDRCWVRSGNDRFERIICMPQVTKTDIDRFIQDAAVAVNFGSAPGRSTVPPRTRPGRAKLTAGGA